MCECLTNKACLLHGGMVDEPWRPWERQRKSGFEDDPEFVKPCYDTGHKPPMYLVIPQGKIYRHVCPSCGQETILRPMRVTL